MSPTISFVMFLVVVLKTVETTDTNTFPVSIHNLVNCCDKGENYYPNETSCGESRPNEGSTPRWRNLSSILPKCSENNTFVTKRSLEIPPKLPDESYCIGNNGRQFVELSCRATSQCHRMPCIRKCCPLGKAFVLPDKNCTDAEVPFSVDSVVSSLPKFGIMFGDPCIYGMYQLEPDVYQDDEYYLTSNGSLYVARLGFVSNSDYCLEFVGGENASAKVLPFLCFPEEAFSDSYLKDVLLAVGLLISSICFLATFLIYLFMPKGQNLFFRTLMCYVFTLFVAYLCLALIELLSNKFTSGICRTMGKFFRFQPCFFLIPQLTLLFFF